MNRIAGIIIAALGLVVAVLGATKIVPGLTSPGVFMIVLGGLVIGLSFINKPAVEGDVERMSTASSIVNIFFAPSEVFRNLRWHPRWLVPILLMVVMSVAYSNLFSARIGIDRITNFSIDKTLEMPMIAGSEDARKSVEAGRVQALEDAKNPVARVGQVAASFAGFTILYAILALIYFVFALAMGGKLNFWQAFSAAVYAALPINIIKFVLNTTLLYLKDPTDIHPILGQQSLIQDNLSFLVTSAEHPVIFTLLASLSVLGFYWLFMNAIGLKNAGERVSGTIAWSASISVFLFVLLFGMAMAVLFPSFIS
ncbi:MAG TPA: YIP1 family protein [Pyrinomonadaceae bacterium]|nr:YIP1 family protein [Chloracidobacterium sp.]MBP9935980.1 YIP1 family protein [Pyrinomonadaceae bacterium]MBK9439522.1 YIP1 family protein [Chloracidobacterium sp.]MBK9768353.1 YIP1 family protein [Chloracidobacterium sp.]MBL0239190.1 YIP1 family protein [Chloracidobacterium sp.]